MVIVAGRSTRSLDVTKNMSANDQPTAGDGGVSRFGAWLSIRRNFMLFSIAAFGGGTLIAAGFMLHPPTPTHWIVVGVLCLSGGYVWGRLMWLFFEAKRKE